MTLFTNKRSRDYWWWAQFKVSAT